MKISLLADFFMDIKNWVYNWDTVTFAIIVTIISLLMAVSAITFLKAIISDKPKFKLLQIIFLALLITMLVLIIIVRK